jgi:hypothetical protein
MGYYFRYTSDELGIPKSSWRKVVVLTCSVMLLLTAVTLPPVLIQGLSGYVVGYLCCGGVVFVLLHGLMNL